ncbi:MAG: undecaprenyl-diphosphate phosphatase [Chlamydiota bacterium]
MSLFEAFIFGILQGITEFLPISSSAHLKFAKLCLGVPNSEEQVLFDLVCHLGTLTALLFYLKKEISTLFRRNRQKLFFVLVATFPLVPSYLLLKPLREAASQPQFLGLCLIVTAAILWLGQHFRFKRPAMQLASSSEDANINTMRLGDVLWIGFAQSAALIPGISRSASTISCARSLGWSAKDAVRFSFLLCIPTIIAGNCLELLKIYVSHPKTLTISFPSCTIGFIASLVFGVISIRWAIPYLEKGNFKSLAYYCFVLGIVVTAYTQFYHGGH